MRWRAERLARRTSHFVASQATTSCQAGFRMRGYWKRSTAPTRSHLAVPPTWADPRPNSKLLPTLRATDGASKPGPTRSQPGSPRAPAQAGINSTRLPTLRSWVLSTACSGAGSISLAERIGTAAIVWAASLAWRHTWSTAPCLGAISTRPNISASDWPEWQAATANHIVIAMLRAQVFPRHPEVLASSASLEGRRPGLHPGRSSFEAPDGALRTPSLAPQDDGTDGNASLTTACAWCAAADARRPPAASCLRDNAARRACGARRACATPPPARR
ncbi:hypothetical protein ABIE85_002727 [Bradyrhizobium diazoefficiens]